MRGKIIKGIAGFYYVFAENDRVYECKARGIFRKDHQKPLVGDNVILDVLDDAEGKGNITELLDRKSSLIRPAVANADQALVIFAAEDPKPNLMLMDKFLVMMEQQDLPVTICFNKADLAADEDLKKLKETYEISGYRVILTSMKTGDGSDALDDVLKNKITVVAGPSGVGKSSITNHVQSGIEMETGEISKKLGRGRHTTRHSQIIPVDQNTFIVDTPGFSSLYVENIEKEDLRLYFPEFLKYEGKCRFQGCVHIHEPDCAVKSALQQGYLSDLRYNNYVALYEEIKSKRRY